MEMSLFLVMGRAISIDTYTATQLWVNSGHTENEISVLSNTSDVNGGTVALFTFQVPLKTWRNTIALAASDGIG